MNLPPIVSETEWQQALDRLLVQEKAVTHASDAAAAARRRLPMVEITTGYQFDGPSGRLSFGDLFEGRRQLVIYHFMFDPDWDAGCKSCSFFVDQMPSLVHLHQRDTSFVLVSKAPLAKLEAYKSRLGWDFPWYSSFGTSFNADFKVTDPSYGEVPGLSCFVRDGDRIFRTYFTQGRGVDALLATYVLLDRTLFGRQEDWESSPAGWPIAPTGFRRHDEYPTSD